MSCCGNGRVQLTGVRPGTAPNAAQRTAFEYTGRTTMIVVSPITGRRYHFAGPGARVEIDARDRQYLTAIPRLRATR